jgi:hypothetical protein
MRRTSFFHGWLCWVALAAAGGAVGCGASIKSLVDHGRIAEATDGWTRMLPIRTTAQLALEVAVFTSEPFRYQQIAGEARRKSP